MGFYDFKGYWRNDGEGFYDAKGYFRNPGEGFYDSKGYFRSLGDGFYDAKGNWVNPGGAFYDSKGYLRTSVGTSASAYGDEGSGIVAAVGLIVFIPIGILYMMATFWVRWITENVYLFFWGYVFITALLNVVITKVKKHRGINFGLSYAGNYICILSFIYIILIYAVPYVVGHGGSLLDFVLVLMFALGGVTVVQFLNYYHEKAVWEFILGVLFFVVVVSLLKDSSGEIYTIESLAEIYNVKASVMFKVLFGFAIG